MSERPRWVIEDRWLRPSTCFPADLNTSDFVEITAIDDSWARFLDPKTGRVHSCEQYRKEMVVDMMRSE